jgi:hypothetical protein
MRSVQVEDGVTRVRWHCAKDAPAKSHCAIEDDCGHDFSKAGEITYHKGEEYTSVTYQEGKYFWGMRAKEGATGCSTVLENTHGLVFGDFRDMFWAENGWEEPQWVPQVDDLEGMKAAGFFDNGTKEETVKAEEGGQQSSVMRLAGH